MCFRVDFSLILWWHEGFLQMTTFSWFHENYISRILANADFFLILWEQNFADFAISSQISRVNSPEILFWRKFDPAKIKTLKPLISHFVFPICPIRILWHYIIRYLNYSWFKSRIKIFHMIRWFWFFNCFDDSSFLSRN